MTFSSTTEYFQYLAGQDLEQLDRQPSSAYSRHDAMAKYRAFKVLESLVPHFVHSDYDCAKFKIICDDLGLANLLVRSREDLTVVGVVDFEWSYVGPAQLFGSAPWWLLMDRPTNPAWDCDKEEPTQLTGRYLRYLDIFQRVLEEEEARTPGCEGKELSSLVRWSRHSGAMWIHMLLSTGFNGPCTFPFTRLIEHVGSDAWAKFEKQVSEDEAAAFGARKVLQLREYEDDFKKLKAQKAMMDEGKLSKEDFSSIVFGHEGGTT